MRAEIISDIHLVSTSDLSLDCMNKLPTNEQSESRFQDLNNSATMSTSEKELSRSATSTASINGTQISGYGDITDSYCSSYDVTNSYTSMAWRQNVNNDSVLTPNKTLTSTPELPVCDSSTLDIPFASMFDLMDFQDAAEKMSPAMKVFGENIRCSSETTTPKFPGCSDLQRITDLHHSMKLMTTTSTDSPARNAGHGLAAPVHCQVKPGNYGSEETGLPRGILDEITAVRSPAKSLTKFLQDVLNNGDENNNSHSRSTDVDFELEREVGAGTYDGSVQETSEEDVQNQSERSSIFRTDTELTTLPSSSEAVSRIQSAVSLPSTTECSFLCSTYRDTLLQAHASELSKQSDTLTTSTCLDTERFVDIPSSIVSWSECELTDQAQAQHILVKQSVSQDGHSLPSRNDSWSYYTIPDTKQNTPTSQMERDSVKADNYITVRAKLPQIVTMALENDEMGSVVKRRKCQATTTLTVNSPSHQGRSVRKRLPFKSPLKPTSVDHHHHHTLGSDVSNTSADTPLSARTVPYLASSGKCKHCLPSSSQSHYTSEFRPSQGKLLAEQSCQRKPLAERYIARQGNCNIPAEHASCLSVTPDSDSDTWERSPDTFSSSHQDYKFHRGTTKCYLREARHSNYNNSISRNVQVSRAYKDHAGNYILRDPETNEIIERKVEGAENVPTSLVFPMKRRADKVLRTVVHGQKQPFQQNSLKKKVNKNISGRAGMSKRKLDRSSDLRTHSRKSNELSREASSGYHGSQCTTESGQSKKSTKSHQTHKTHPIACSTLIRDDNSSGQESDKENTSTWTLNKESSFSNFQKSNLCSTRLNDKHTINNDNKIYAVPVYMGRDFTLEYPSNGKGFKISSIVSQIDKKMSHSRLVSNTDMSNLRQGGTRRSSKRCKPSKVTKEASSEYNFSATQPLSQTMATSFSSGALELMETHEEECSPSASEQATNSSMFSNQATASMTSSPSEENTISEQNQWSYECKNSSQTSAKDSVKQFHNYSDDDDLPTAEDQMDMHQKYNTSDDSLCSAARCRPRYSNQKPEKILTSESSSRSSHSILDSILTGSPKSVNPSGILAPDNSSSDLYNECADLNDFYSNPMINPFANLQNIWPGVPTSYGKFQPKIYCLAADDKSSTCEKNNSDFVVKYQTKATRNIGVCYNPHTTVSDSTFVNPQCYPTRPAVSSSGRTMTQQSQFSPSSHPTSSAVSTSSRSPSVSKDHQERSRGVVPPVNDPSKVKHKYSLGHKLRKLRNNVYKKTKKLKLLHICDCVIESI